MIRGFIFKAPSVTDLANVSSAGDGPSSPRFATSLLLFLLLPLFLFPHPVLVAATNRAL